MEADQFALSNVPSVLEAILANQIINAKAAEKAQAEQAKAQAEQAKAQAEQAKAQAEQAKAHTAAYIRLEQRIISFENTVVRKLEIIEANTVTIMGMQIQDFNGIAPETKLALEEAGEEIAQNESLLEFIEVVETDTLIPRRGQSSSKLSKATPIRFFGSGNLVTVKDAVANLELEDYIPSLIPVGNYVSSIITKIWNYNFGGKYPIYFAPLIEALVTYHQTERVSPRKY
jgi:multidrug efflux pump subunit AcrA (membrane-fusion protein)